MEKILAKRYAFCDFSDIVGFPHPVPTINEWGDYLPRFRGSKYDHPVEHLFNFHQCMLDHGFVHEDVLIKLFKFSLEGNARKWCQSLPAISIHSLKDFHVAFNSYYEKIYSADLLFPECCHEEEIVPVANLKSEEHSLISASDSFRPAELEEDSLQFSDLQGLSNLQLEHVNQIPSSPDQQPIGNVSPADFEQISPADLEQFTHTIEIKEDSQPHYFHLQSEQKLKEVFHYYLIDPIANFLESTNNVNDKVFFIEQSWSDHLFEPFFYMIWLHLLFESRLKMPVNHNLTWLHWKSSVT